MAFSSHRACEFPQEQMVLLPEWKLICKRLRPPAALSAVSCTPHSLLLSLSSCSVLSFLSSVCFTLCCSGRTTLQIPVACWTDWWWHMWDMEGLGGAAMCPPLCFSMFMCMRVEPPLSLRNTSWCKPQTSDSPLPSVPGGCLSEARCSGSWTVWYHVCLLMHKIKLQAKSQYLIMLIFNFAAFFYLAAGIGSTEMSSNGKSFLHQTLL